MSSISLMSAPAANARSPAPVRTTTRAVGVVRELAQAVAELGERLQVERVQRVLAVDRDDDEPAAARLDADGYAGTFARRNSTISAVGVPGVNTAPTPSERQRLGILVGDRAADDDEHVLGPVLAQPVEDPRDERHVRAGEDRDANGVRVLLDRGLHDLLRGLVETRVDHLHSRVPQGAGDDLRAPVVPVQTRLGDHYTDPLRHPGRQYRDVKLIVVGCSPAWPNPGGAQSGYLVEADGALLLDCGAGVLAKLRLRESWPHVDSIVISHWHLDHWGDLVPWVWGSMFRLGGDGWKPELWLPPGGIDLLGAFGDRMGTPRMFWNAFQLLEYAEGEAFETAAGATVTATEVPHYTIQTFAFRVTNGDKTLAYSGDSAPRSASPRSPATPTSSSARRRSPRTPRTATRAATCARARRSRVFEQSGAARLLLTHRPEELPVSPGIETARDGLELDV